jgi:glycosyltransferase involved in cell wall biosynthesis
MRWLLLTDGMSPFELGGMQKHSANLLKQLLLAGDEVDVAHCITGTNSFHTNEEVLERLSISPSASCTIQQFTFPKMGNLPGHYLKESYAYSLSLFKHYQQREGYWDVVFAQGFTGWKFIEERKKGKWRVPIINHFHGLEMFQAALGWKDRLQQWMFRSPVLWNIRNADFTVSLGGRINQILSDQGVDRNKILDLPVAIDANWLRKDEKKVHLPLQLLFVGRFETRKGLKQLLEAFTTWDQQGNDIRLTVVGNIPPTQRIKHANVHFKGVIQEEQKMKDIMDNHDVLVVPSFSEGMPTVILEAMSRKMAIMCTKVGATEVMVNEENGFLLESPKVADILHGLKKISLWSPEQINEMGRISWEKVNVNWTWEKVMNAWRPQVQNIVLKK